MAKQPLTVTVITDTHYYSKKLGTDGKAYEKGNSKSQLLLERAEEVLKAAFEQIKKDNRTDIVLLSGDTTSNGDFDSHKEFIEMLRDLKKSGKRVFVLTATHDFKDDGKTYAYRNDEKVDIPAARREDLYDMYREFGPDQADSVHRQSMSYSVKLQDGYRLLAINDDRNLSGKSGVSDDCFEWIRSEVEKARANGEFVLAMTHHPLIAPSPIYGLIGKNDMFGDFDVRREQFADLGMQFMLTGHTHIHSIDKITSKRGNTFYTIATASLIGYPGTIRTVTVDDDGKSVKTTTDLITEKPDFEMQGDMQEYLKNQLAGMVKDMVKAAAGDTETFANMVTSISIKKKVVYKFGWLIKPVAKLLNKLTIGTVAKWTKKETGLKKEDYADIKNDSVVDFIIDMVLNLYGGENLYNPDQPQYKIAMGLISIFDSILSVLHIDLKKLLKVDSLYDFAEPLIHNRGINAYETELPIMPFYDEGEQGEVAEEEKPEHTIKSKKGLPIIIISVLLLIILLIPLALVLLVGFIINQIKYGKEIKIDE